MNLTTEGGLGGKNIGEQDIVEAFRNDAKRGGFIILSHDNQMIYMQAAGDEDGSYILEYQDGSLESHYQCPNELSKARVQEAFIKYFRNDATWRSDFDWQRISMP